MRGPLFVSVPTSTATSASSSSIGDVLEVETPILSAAGNTDPNIESFTTRFTGHVDAGQPQRWLRTSPEFPLKRMLAAGIGDCYELGRVFRNGEAGRSAQSGIHHAGVVSGGLGSPAADG